MLIFNILSIFVFCVFMFLFFLIAGIIAHILKFLPKEDFKFYVKVKAIACSVAALLASLGCAIITIVVAYF